jgi:hypothetical protein
MVICYNCRKNNYFILLCPELKNIGNIKEIKEDTSKELKKRTLKEDFFLGYLINFKRINLS